MRHQEYPGTGEDTFHKQPELQKSTQCLFLCPKQHACLNLSLFWGTYPEAEAHSNGSNGWFCFCIYLWDVGLDFRLKLAAGILPQVPCPASLWSGIFMCPTVFNFYQNRPGLMRFGDLSLCSDISSRFRTNSHSLCKAFLPAGPQVHSTEH